MLDNKDTDIDDPTTRTNFHAPTAGNEEVTAAKKINYAHVSDRAPFVGTTEVDKLDRYKRRLVNPVTKKLLREVTPICANGAPRPDFILENRLDGDSMPNERFEPSLQRSLTSQWTSYTNHKIITSQCRPRR